MKKPNLFIVGAAKAGTTTLWKYLKQHPNVYMPDDEISKEPSYFSTKFHKLDLNRYLELFSEAAESHKIIGEASTAYLTDPTSCQKIYEFNPESKIIIILRNPADRAYSLYNWMRQEGYELATSFEDALKKEKKRVEKKIPNFFESAFYWNYLYFNSGLYYEQVKRYVDGFGENVLVLTFEEFMLNQKAEMEKIYRFLGLEFIETSVSKENESLDIYSPYLQFIFRKLSKLVSDFKSVFVSKTTDKKRRDFLIYFGQKKIRPRRMSEITRKILLEKYKDDIIKLSDLTKMDFTSWLKTGIN